MVAAATDARAKLGRWSAIDGKRIDHWTPVAIGLGAGLYFGLKGEPLFWVAPLLVAVCLALGLKTQIAPRVFKTAFLIGLGFIAADFRNHQVEAPMLGQELNPRMIVGKLVSIGEGERGRRLTLEVETIDRLAPDETPARIRVNWRGQEFNAKPGERISLRAGLSPPPPPVAPGAFDFARHLYLSLIHI